MNDRAAPTESAAERFLAEATDRLGSAPVAAARAPGRVNLIGEHIDYCGGIVMPIAIPQSCYAAVAPNPDGGDRVTLTTTFTDGQVDIDPNTPITPGGVVPIGSWASYIIGVMRGFQGHTALAPLAGMRLHVHSGVPVGAGLSSSAALEVATAYALQKMLGTQLAPIDIAKLCQTAEHDFAGVPCGLMDQAASAMCRAGHALMLDCATDVVQWAPVMSSASLIVVHSGVSHSLAAGEYAKRRAACESAAATLGVEHLAHANTDALAKLPSDIVPFARHVITEQQRVLAAQAALNAGDARGFGELMSASHASLRDDYLVSCDEVDALVDSISAVDGCHGARMTGGGFGGCVIALAEPEAEERVRSAADGCRSACPNMRHIPVEAGPGAEVIA